MMMTTRFAILSAAVLIASGLAASAAGADKDEPKRTVTLRSGNVLQDAYILDKSPNGITIAYETGCKFIPFSDMPLEYQQKFGYDPIKSARYERKLSDQKKAAEKEEKARKEKQKQRKSDDDKHYKDKRISVLQQQVRKLELQLDEAKKKLETPDKAIREDSEDSGMSSFDSTRATIESPWGYGGRISSGKHNAAVTGKLMKNDTLNEKRDSQVQEAFVLQLKLEAAQRALDEMLGEN